MRLKWGIDIDGVCCDWLQDGVKLVEAMTGRPVPPVKSWTFDKDVQTPEEFEAYWDYLDTHPNWWENLQPLPGTREALSELYRASRFKKHDVYFISSRHARRGMKLTTERWLDTHGFPHATVLLTKPEQKATVVDALNVDVFVDDVPSICIDVAARCPDTAVYIVSEPSVAASRPYLNALDLTSARVGEVTSLASLVKRVLS